MRFLQRHYQQPLLLMNLDETGVPLFNGDRKGTVLKLTSVPRLGERSTELVQYATTSETRGQATHIAIICDDASVQPHLPQVIVGPSNLLTVTVCRDLQPELADNVYLLRLKSRWTDRVLMESVLKTLARVLAERCPLKVPVLLLDTAPSHMHPSLPRLARRLGMHLVLVPARTTWLLQPCDVFVFRKYKHAFREVWLRAKMNTPDGRLEPRAFWNCLCEHVNNFMTSQAWSAAFEQTGYTNEAADMSRSTRARLQLPQRWTPPAVHEPTPADLEVMLPRNKRGDRWLDWLPLVDDFRPSPASRALQRGAADAEEPLPSPAREPAASGAVTCRSPSVHVSASAAAPTAASSAAAPLGTSSAGPAFRPPGPLTRSRSRALATAASESAESDQPPVAPRAMPTSLPTAAPADAAEPISARTRSRSSATSTAA